MKSHVKIISLVLMRELELNSHVIVFPITFQAFQNILN